MPSHIFTRLGLWQESIRSNLDSEASANAIAAKKQAEAIPFDAIHALDYLEYAYLQTEQIDEAKKIVDRVARAAVVRLGVLGWLCAGRDSGALRARAACVEASGGARSAKGDADLGALSICARADAFRARDRRRADGGRGGGQARGG